MKISESLRRGKKKKKNPLRPFDVVLFYIFQRWNQDQYNEDPREWQQISTEELIIQDMRSPPAGGFTR